VKALLNEWSFSKRYKRNFSQLSLRGALATKYLNGYKYKKISPFGQKDKIKVIQRPQKQEGKVA